MKVAIAAGRLIRCLSFAVALIASGPLAAGELLLDQEDRDYLDALGALKVPAIAHQSPLSFTDDGVPTGYLNDLFVEAAATLGIEVLWQHGLSYADSLSALEKGSVVALSDYSHIRGERDFALVTTPVMRARFVAVGSADAEPVRTLADLENKRIVLVKNFQQTRAIQEKRPGLNFLLVDHIDDAYRALRSNDADYYIDNYIHAGYYLRSSLVTDLGIAGELPDEELGTLELRFAVNRSTPRLHTLLQRALDSIDPARVRELQNKWTQYSSLTDRAVPVILTAAERAWVDEHPVIRVALDPGWAPVEYRDQSGGYKGMSLEYLALLERLLDIKFEIVAGLSWTEAVSAVRRKSADMFASVSRTPQREEFAIFTEPYIEMPIGIFAREEITFFKGLRNLQGMKVAVPAGYAIQDWLSRDHPELDLVPVESPADGLKQVSDGKVDVFVGNVVTANYYLGKLGLHDVRSAGETPYANLQAMAVRDDWPILAAILNKALAAIPAREHEAIYNRWMSIRFEHSLDTRVFWQAGFVVLVIMTAVMYWNRRLKKEVDRRVIAEQLLLEHQHQLEERVEERTRALSEREALLEHMVHHDALTGLPNRTLLNIRLEQSIKHSARQHMMMGVVFIDIDRFKNINDSIGHVSGDKLLQQLAERLQNAVRAVDTVARISGDEFVVILEDIDSSDHAVLVMEKLMSTVRKPYVIDDAKVSATVSMGLSLYPDDGDDPATLLCNADAAMYQSKEGGRNSCQLFTGEMSAAVQERAFLESALHTALEEAQFRLVYQPKVDLQSGKYIGMEALLRWCHPDKGEISPAHFIPIAEQSGIIRDIGSWVLKTACAQGAAWLQERLAIGRIAVNVAGQQIQQSNFQYIVQSIIEETGLPPENLELEITESFVMRQAETGIEHLRKIRDLGVEIAIDDFGTGYSSLGYLKQLPIDRLKIDRSFVSEIPHDVNDMAICESVIGMGKALGIKIIAEGVEDEAHVAFLREKGCLEAQGYFFAKPLPPDEIARLFPRLGESSLSKPIG